MEDFNFSTPDFGSNPLQYLKDSRAELKQVKWPSKQQLINNTTLVLVISVIVGLILGLSDYLFAQLFTLLLK